MLPIWMKTDHMSCVLTFCLVYHLSITEINGTESSSLSVPNLCMPNRRAMGFPVVVGTSSDDCLASLEFISHHHASVFRWSQPFILPTRKTCSGINPVNWVNIGGLPSHRKMLCRLWDGADAYGHEQHSRKKQQSEGFSKGKKTRKAKSNKLSL